jgi:tetratricopeptide (TPR) repeat protein
MISFLRASWLPLAAVAVLLPLIGLLSDAANANRVALSENYEDSDLEFQGSRLKGFALGAEGLLADWYWIRSLQYIGGKIVRTEFEQLNIDDLRSLNPRLLYPLLDNATDLDPSYMAAYSYGAVMLPAIDTELAIRLTEKGIRDNPKAWRLHQYLGYIYWHSKNFEKAAETYDAGSRIEGAPPFLRQMAAAMRAQGGSRDTARLIYSQMLAEAEDRQSRESAELRLMQLDSLDQLDAINSILKQQPACPSSLTSILPRLRNVNLPNVNDFKLNDRGQLVDPSGVPYVLHRESCTAAVDDKNSVIPQF